MNKMLENETEVGYYMRLAVQCGDKHMEAATGEGDITITADEAFALFMLVRFANSHPKFKLNDDSEPTELCMAQAAVAYLSVVLSGICPDCGHSVRDAETGHSCRNHTNEYPLPDTMETIPHPPKKECH